MSTARPGYEHALNLIPTKLNKVRRPDKTSYCDAQTLETDKTILDSLPQEEFMTTIANSKNSGTYFLYYLLNFL
jgi:hypothetical protein